MDIANMIQKAFKFTTPTPLSVKRSRLESTRVHFTITAYTVLEPDGTGQRKEVKSLEAGKCYEIIVLCERSRNQSDQLDCLIVEDCELSLQAAYTLQVSYQPLPCKPIAVAYKDISQPKYQLPAWSLDIPDDLPTCELTLSLTIKEPSFHPKDNISSQDFHIQGHTILENTQLLAASNIATGLPENAAVLTIASENSTVPSNSFVLHCHNRHIGEAEMVLEKGLIVGAAQRYPNASISTILATIHTFSSGHSANLVQWLSKLYNACRNYQKRPCIIVVDTTGGGLEISWELIEMKQYLYLGAVAQIVRWYPFCPFGTPKMLEVKEVVYEGPVLTYIDHKLPGVEHEQAVLNGVEKREIKNLQELRQCFKQDGKLAGVGLVYIASHGHGSNALLVKDGDQAIQKPNEMLRALETEGMPEHQEPRPVFFVNACDSARMLRNKEKAPNSFVESFLVQCASNYIGTTAPVSSLRASMIAKDVLMQATEEKGVQIAEMLRHLREQAAERLRLADLTGDERKVQYEKELFYTFMYVYYGNPLARLRLRPVSSEKEGA